LAEAGFGGLTMSLPAPLPALDLSAPLDRHRARVKPEWIDANGHMNVGYYVVAFDHATDTLCEQLGVSWDYTRRELGMIFVLEAHVTYDRELLPDAPFRVTTQILGHDAKRMHVFHEMHHAEENFLAATNELMIMHVDFKTRRAAPWPAETHRRLAAMAAAHKRLPWPVKAGRVIGLKKS
jgi:acyl-CoA thioester hydrolase